ncbi:MAG: hypothetical protein ACT4PT_02185 [Methanobacteriota archaeon]
MPRVFLVASIVLAAPLAGCVEGGLFDGNDGGPGGDGATAKDLEPTARRTALERVPGAELAFAMGFEFMDDEDEDGGADEDEDDEVHDAEDALEEEFGHTPDSDPGDGRAPAWMYIYRASGTNETVFVMVAANGTVLKTETDNGTEPDGETFEPIGEWRVDSDRAVEAAIEGDVEWRAVHDTEGEHGAMSFLFHEAGAPHAVWVLMIFVEPEDGNESRGGFESAGVDAVTGELVPVPDAFDFDFDFDFSWEFPPTTPSESYEASGQLTRLLPEATLPFGVREGHVGISIEVEWSSTLPTDELELVVVDPDGGETVTEGGPGGPGRSFSWSTASADLATGDWSAVLRLGGTQVAAQYSMSVCVHGQGAFDFGCEFPFGGAAASQTTTISPLIPSDPWSSQK